MSSYEEVIAAFENNPQNEFCMAPIKERTFEEVFDSAATFFKDADILLHVDSPCVVVGDLHGSMGDLLKIFASSGSPSNTRYLFLGDYIDRGKDSLGCLVLVTSLMLAYPENVSMLRGNHEFIDVNTKYGFLDEILEAFGKDDVFRFANKMFNYMPLAAILGNKYFCVHGGLSPKLSNVMELINIERPINGEENQSVKSLVQDLVWSDPDESIQFYANSTRGVGKKFGFCAVDCFLKTNDLNGTIRAHQYVESGIQTNFRGKVITVFSNSDSQKQAGYLEIDRACDVIPVQLTAAIQCNKQKISSPFKITNKTRITCHHITSRRCGYVPRLSPPRKERRYSANYVPLPSLGRKIHSFSDEEI